MTLRFSRPVGVALGCLFSAGSIGVVGSHLAATPASAVRTAAAPTPSTAAPATTTSTSTTLPPTTTTVAPTTTTAAPKPTTSTTTRRERFRVSTPTTVAIECTMKMEHPSEGREGRVLLTVRIPSMPNATIRIGVVYTDFEDGGLNSTWGVTGTDASGQSGVVDIHWADLHMSGQPKYVVTTEDRRTQLCERPVTNPDGTMATS